MFLKKLLNKTTQNTNSENLSATQIKSLSSNELAVNLDSQNDFNNELQSLNKLIDWCIEKHKLISSKVRADSRHKNITILLITEQVNIQREQNKNIDEFSSKVIKCNAIKSKLNNALLRNYQKNLIQLKTMYGKLEKIGNQRLRNLESLLELLKKLIKKINGK